MHRDCELLVIGGGMAAGRLMQQLHEHAYSKKTIVISGEKHAGYNRVMLPGFLAGQYSVEQMCGQADWQSRSNFTVLPGLTVTQIEQSSRSVLTDSGMQIGFTELVIATGSTVVRPQTTGTELAGVVELRNLNDAEQLQSMAARGRHAVVVGGGLLGLEAADALLQLGMQVRVVHRGGQLMNRQLDQAAGEELGRILSHRGMHLSLGAQLGAIEGDRQVESVVLDDGASYPADLVLLATGVQPNTALAADCGIHCRDGICTDDQLRTSAAGVYALGECARIAGEHHSLVEATHQQADALAGILTGLDHRVQAVTPGTRLKVGQIAVFAAGETRPVASPDANDIVIRDNSEGIYRRLLFSGSRLIGAVLLGNIQASREITRRIGSCISAAEREQLAFGFS